jgi:photosystem II stability/assembly factor-like uncharacterized protein
MNEIKIKVPTKFSLGILLTATLLLSASCVPFTDSKVAGVVKTTNGGTDWQAANTIKDSEEGLGSVSVSVLGFDPGNEQRLLMASYSDGLYKSENSAESWERILSKISVYDFVVDPENSDTIYAAGFFADHGKALVTRDGGKAWVEIYSEASTQNAVRAIAMNPSNHSEIIIGMTSGNVIKSTDRGTTWKVLTNFEDRVNRILYIGNNLYVLLRSKGLQKSVDGGQTFVSLSDALARVSGEALYDSLLPLGSYSQLAVSRNNPNLIYVTAESGLYKTTDEGKSWARVSVPVKNDEVAFKAVALDPANDSVVYTAAGTTIYKSSDGGQTFQIQAVSGSGFVNYLLVNPIQSQIVYAGIFVQ